MTLNALKKLTRLFAQAVVVPGEASFVHPVSQACTYKQMQDPLYAQWSHALYENPSTHRKQWEFCYILQALHTAGMLEEGRRGLGFGVGDEPLTAAFAARGIGVMATDLEVERAAQQGWVETDQHARSKEVLNGRGLCPPEQFERLVDFRFMDMNRIDRDLTGFDFCWSACALEHLGSIEQGLAFIEASLDCLKPGGVAVHTTEFNCQSDDQTLDNASTVLFRKRDFLALARRLRRRGHDIVLNFDLGDQPLDQHIDVPPYAQENHLKLQIAQWVTTSYGLVVRKAA
ncbi:SAM-dependent methyltransferase [Novosphingobium sp.]|uniref:SAM-dependent methyltransferase n=1 Tax=Novosphingobium sp. TaxID=1874826 RepID=UPI003BA8E3A0